MREILTAMKIAADVHAGQTDLTGQPYIGHPLRVAALLAQEGHGQLAVMAAILHDALEDGPPETLGLVLQGVGSLVGRTVEILTRREGEPYEVYIDRVAQDEWARMVKVADLRDNLDPRRPLPDTVKSRRLELRYREALARLQAL